MEKRLIRLANPDLANLDNPEILTLKQAQQKLLSKDDILLQYALGQDRSYLFAVTKTGMTVHTLAGQETIESTATEFFGHLTARRREGDIADTGACLNQLILPPGVVQQMQGKRVIIAADGILHTIPFAALPLPSTSASQQDACSDEAQTPDYKPLISQFELVNIPSLTAKVSSI